MDFTQEELEDAARRSRENFGAPEIAYIFVSFAAHTMLERILAIDPKFFCLTETEIWLKAHELGLKRESKRKTAMRLRASGKNR